MVFTAIMLLLAVLAACGRPVQEGAARPAANGPAEGLPDGGAAEPAGDAGPAEPVPLAFDAQIIRTNGYQDGAVYPAVVEIGSAEELARYMKENRDRYDLGHKDKVYADTTIGFEDAVEGYDDAWFRDHRLVLVVLEEGSGSVRHEVTAVTGGPEPVIEIARLCPEVGTDDMAEWHILIALDRDADVGGEFTVNLTRRNV